VLALATTTRGTTGAACSLRQALWRQGVEEYRWRPCGKKDRQDILSGASPHTLGVRHTGSSPYLMRRMAERPANLRLFLEAIARG
jgi:hypothetical protein